MKTDSSLSTQFRSLPLTSPIWFGYNPQAEIGPGGWGKGVGQLRDLSSPDHCGRNTSDYFNFLQRLNSFFFLKKAGENC